MDNFSVSIIIPTFNRKKFEKLISHNINSQDYPFITEILIADDGDDDERLVLSVPYSVLYFKVDRTTIGSKRNMLINKASGNYIACMDTDDFYNPKYLSTSIFNLIKNNKEVSGSSNMLMLNKTEIYSHSCIYTDMLNEATLVFTKIYGMSHQFSHTNLGEGIYFLKNNIPSIFESDIHNLMICICHDKNTVDKSGWIAEKYLIKKDMTDYTAHLELFSHLNT